VGATVAVKAIRLSEEQYQAVLQRRAVPKDEMYSPAPASKYHNEKTGAYASKKEAQRAVELQLLERAGGISELREQVKFVLVPTQRDADGELIERECSYYADFTYRDANGELVVEDVKSEPTKTRDYRIKRKLMLWVHGVRIRETG
jgi:hypothetical protein